jgi:hypothetical protein
MMLEVPAGSVSAATRLASAAVAVIPASQRIASGDRSPRRERLLTGSTRAAAGAWRSSSVSAARRSSSVLTLSSLLGDGESFGAQLDAKGGEGPGSVAADGARRAAEDTRDLWVVETLVIAKDEHGALPPWQLAELGEEGVTLGVQASVVRGDAVVDLIGRALGQQPPAAAPPGQVLVDDHLPDVQFRMIEPVELIPALARADQHLLDHVLSQRAIGG